MTKKQITPDLIATTVERVADLLEKDGWIFGHMSEYNFTTKEYSYCTLGALRKIEDDWTVRVETEKQLSCALAKLSGSEVAGNSTYPRIAKWNDRHRNGKNVIAKLRKAAAKIRTGECS